MKKGIFLVTATLLSVSSLTYAWEFKLSDKWEYDHRPPENKPFLGSLNVEYASRHIWRGYDLFHNNHGALSTSADIKFGGLYIFVRKTLRVNNISQTKQYQSLGLIII
jgi:hypothetical protein